MVDTVTAVGAILGILLGAAALGVSLYTAIPYFRQRKVDRTPSLHYRFVGPENGWIDGGDVGHPQLNLAIWNDRSVPVELGIRPSIPTAGTGEGWAYFPKFAIRLGQESFVPVAGNVIEIPAHGYRRLFIAGDLPEPAHRGEVVVILRDGERSIRLVYPHRSDDDPSLLVQEHANQSGPSGIEDAAAPG